jgi:hypothetical protein
MKNLAASGLEHVYLKKLQSKRHRFKSRICPWETVGHSDRYFFLQGYACSFIHDCSGFRAAGQACAGTLE